MTDEFQVSSRELEQELEKELEATEARQADLRDRIQRLENEKEEWRVSLASFSVTDRSDQVCQPAKDAQLDHCCYATRDGQSAVRAR